MLNAKLRKQTVDNYNKAVIRYEETTTNVKDKSEDLFDLRQTAVDLIKLVEAKINRLANTPKEFDINIKQIHIEIENFQFKQEEINKAVIEAKKAGKGTGAGATMSALGVAVATMGPTAAMGIATTFGVASTGTAISTLSGAAATNAALAWLGGGAVAVGGKGMTAGAALLGLAGPVGWGIAGVMMTASVGSGIFASRKNKTAATEAVEERNNVEKLIRTFKLMEAEVQSLIDVTITQMTGVQQSNESISGEDYKTFSKDEKFQAGVLINSTLTLAQLINKEVLIND